MDCVGNLLKQHVHDTQFPLPFVDRFLLYGSLA